MPMATMLAITTAMTISKPNSPLDIMSIQLVLVEDKGLKKPITQTITDRVVSITQSLERLAAYKSYKPAIKHMLQLEFAVLLAGIVLAVSRKLKSSETAQNFILGLTIMQIMVLL